MNLPPQKSKASGFLNALQSATGSALPVSGRPVSAKVAVPGYEIQEELGRGGMGVVYKALQVKLNRPVALKMILASEHCTGEALQRFHLEAEAVARLRHPNIVQIYEIGECDGRPYFSLEYIDGGSLAEFACGHPLSPDFAAYLIEQLARGVQCAHEQQIVHRDLKPANILLGQSGPSVGDTAIAQIDTLTMNNVFANLEASSVVTQSGSRLVPKITDFGLAKQLDRNVNLTVTSDLAGTAQYMAPELMQATTRPSVGYAADIYSLGAILYELLTGRPPFVGHNRAQIFLQALTLEPVAPRRLAASVPLDLETICLKSLEKDPTQRYRSAEALANDLRRFLEGRPISARPISRAEHATRWCKRNPAITAVAVLLMVGSVAMSALAAHAWREAGRADQNAAAALVLQAEALGAKTRAETARAEESRLKEEAQTRERQRIQELYSAQIGTAYRAWDLGQIAITRQLLDDHIPQSERTSDSRGFEWHYLDRLCHLDVRRFNAKDVPCMDLVMSPDGHALVMTTPDAVLICDAQTGQARLRLGGDDGIQAVAACPATGQIAAVNRLTGTIQIWNATDGGPMATFPRDLAPNEFEDISAVRFTPNGQMLICSYGDLHGAKRTGRIVVRNAKTGTIAFRREFSDGRVLAFAISLDGKQIAAASESGKLYSLAIDGSLPEEISLGSAAVSSLAWSNDGKSIVAGTRDGEMVFIDAAAMEIVLRRLAHPRPILHLAFNSDSSRIASAGADRIVRVWDVSNGTELTAFRGHADSITGLTFLPHESELLVSCGRDGMVKTWDIRTPAESRRVKIPSAARVAVVGEKAIVVARQGGVSSHQFGSAPAAPEFPAFPFALEIAVVSPTGDRIAAVNPAEPKRLYIAAPGANAPVSIAVAEPVRGIVFSPDGRLIATLHTTDWVRIYRIEGGAPLQIHTRTPIRRLAFRPDGGQFMGFGEDGTVRVWDAATGDERFVLTRTKRDVMELAWSPDGQIAAIAADESVDLFDIGTKKKLWTVKGHTEPVRSVSFSPDGSRLATASEDGTVKLWATATGLEMLTLRAHRDAVTFVAFTADGKKLVSQSDGELRIWETAH